MTHFPLPDSIPAPSLSPQQNDRQLPDTPKAQARNFVNNYNKTTSTKGSPPHFKPWSQSQTQKIQKRHRVERNRPHLLLTPPLTPSSSIRTTASVESGVTTSAIGSICENEDTHEVQDTGDEVEGDDSGMGSTRFFLVRIYFSLHIKWCCNHRLILPLVSFVSSIFLINRFPFNSSTPSWPFVGDYVSPCSSRLFDQIRNSLPFHFLSLNFESGIYGGLTRSSYR